jgi:hypothetical protein
MGNVFRNAQTGFIMTGMGLLWIWRNWSLVTSIWTFPRLPGDWSNSEQVRLFFLALMRSRAISELIKLAPNIRWTHSMVKKLELLADNVVVWNFVWDFMVSPPPEPVIPDGPAPRRVSLRDRIRDRMDARRLNSVALDVPEGSPISLAGASDMEDLLNAVKALKLVFDKTARLE